MIDAAPPAYLKADADRAIWHAMATAVERVRAEASARLMRDHGNAEALFDREASAALDARIHAELIPRALAEAARSLPPGTDLPPFAADVLFSAVRGYAELDPLMIDPQVTEVIIDGPGQEIYVERGGSLHGTGIALSQERIAYLIERIAGDSNETLSDSHPVLEMRMPRGRATAVHRRIVPRGPSLVVRLHARQTLVHRDLIAFGTIPERLWNAVAAAFRAGANVLVAGEIGSGKTTFLQALLAALPTDRRIITIEDPIEIELDRPRLQQLEVRPGTGLGTPFDQRQLVRLSLRLRPDHLIVGEVRDGAAWEMVDAMSLGHNGSIATIHGASPAQSLLRLESLCLRAEDVPPLPAVRRAIADALNLVVQMRRLPRGASGGGVQRAVVSIGEVIGLRESGSAEEPYELATLATLVDGALRPTGTPLSPALAARLEEAGEPALFGA